MKFTNILGDEIQPEKVYVILALFLGILFVFIDPPFYVQDEVNHFYRAYQLSDLHMIGEKRRSNFYLLSVPSIGMGDASPVKWTELSSMLVKDQKNNIYVYGFKDGKWRYTKLDSAVFKGIHFPVQNAPPVFLSEKDKKAEIYAEIANKGGLSLSALYQAGDFLPTSIVETTYDIMHHLPAKPYEKENKFKMSTVFTLLHQDLHPEAKIFANFSNTVLYAPFSYVPQICGIVIGKFLQLSPVMMLYLARLFALLCSITLIYYALKLMPILKWSMFLLAMMPLTMWEMASVSYDNLTISLSFLLIAVFFHYALTKPRINNFDIAVIFTLTSLVALSKIAYLPLVFLYLLVPRNKVGSSSKYFTVLFLLLLSNILLVGVWSILAYKVYVPYIYDGNIDPYAQLLYLWKHPMQILNIMWRYCSTFDGLSFGKFMGMVGFVDTPQIFLLDIYFAALLLTSFFSSGKDIRLRVGQRAIVGSVFLINFFVVFVLIYLSSTEVGAGAIDGMRTRYLIPFSILFFSVLQYRGSFKVDVEYYRSRILLILVCAVLFNTLLSMLMNFTFS